MIYQIPGSDDPLDQADVVSTCPIPLMTEFDLEGVKPPQIQVSPCRILVLTQACDLVNHKASNVTVAVVHNAQALVEQNLIKPRTSADQSAPAGSSAGIFCPRAPGCGLPEMIVDLRQIHTVRLDLLTALCQRGHRPARLLTPYREHLAKHFADTFSRIGLPPRMKPSRDREQVGFFVGRRGTPTYAALVKRSPLFDRDRVCAWGHRLSRDAGEVAVDTESSTHSRVRVRPRAGRRGGQNRTDVGRIQMWTRKR